MNKKILIYSIIVLIIDQITKYLVEIYKTSFDIIKNVFGFHYTQNYGASWGILEGKQTLLIVVTIVMIVLVYSMMFSYEKNKLNNLIFGILFGGIIGNFIDRILFGFVRDFISVGSFPVFNIADSAIVIGILLLGIVTLKGEFKDGSKSRNRRKSKN